MAPFARRPKNSVRSDLFIETPCTKSFSFLFFGGAGQGGKRFIQAEHQPESGSLLHTMPAPPKNKKEMNGEAWVL
jgi:hypothetical protein